MKQVTWLLLLLCSSIAANAADQPRARSNLSSNLWLTPEQQAQRALDSGDAATASRLFSDPRRRAYAEIKAGNYAEAAKNLQPFTDASSQYNRGNALARGGDLQKALAAYDAALKQAPTTSDVHRDATHNRDLVARQLQQQKQSQQQNKSGQQNSPGQKNDQSSNQKNDQKDPSAQSSAENNSGNSKQASDQKNSAQQSADNAQSGQQSKPTSPPNNAADKKSENGKSAQQNNAQKDERNSESAKASVDKTDTDKKDAEQAKRDAADALARMQQDKSADNKSKNGSSATMPLDTSDQHTKPGNADAIKPPSEQSLALDQWLRQIPDDPGGLLRRKFMIEHMLKQQEAQQ